MNVAETRAISVQVAITIGERLRKAREAVGLSQLEAAKRLGYANSSKLSKIEGGKSSEVPAWVLNRAGWLYDVSTDYLMGNSASMSRLAGVPLPVVDSACRGLIRDTARRRAEADELIQIAKQMRRIRRMVDVVAPLADELTGAQAAVEQEASWQDVRGGARMADGSRRAVGAIRAAAELVTVG